jgi:hypothetical protein
VFRESFYWYSLSIRWVDSTTTVCVIENFDKDIQVMMIVSSFAMLQFFFKNMRPTGLALQTKQTA